MNIRAELLPGSGGHAHIATVLPFTSALSTDSGPVAGFFLTDSGRKVSDIHLATNASGIVRTKLVAGYLGGQARVIAGAYVGDKTLADTVAVTFAVPGLVRLSDGFPATVYWIGGTNAHPQYQNFYVQSSLVAGLRAIAESLKKTTSGGQTLYAQYNDASLPNGGAFTVNPPGSIAGGIDNPFKDHLAHAVGLDIDIGLCRADAGGNGDDKVHRVKGFYDYRQTPPLTCSGVPDTARGVQKRRLDDVAGFYSGVNGVHPDSTAGNHYHIRFQ